MVGSALGHYRILEKIGAGGMGEVYRAHDQQLQRDVAIKVLPGAVLGDAEARARLLREARAAAALNHPHICTIHQVGEVDGQGFIAMELVEGRPLDQLIPPSVGLPVGRVLEYGTQIAGAAAHAHQRGILHRDLKAANVVITPAGHAKVLDFGLAKRVAVSSTADTTQAHTALTLPGSIAGTIAYMAPEQLRGQPADARSDVWALGVLLHEMAAGERPFTGATAFEISSAILGDPLRPLPRIPAPLQRVITRCLAKSSAERYQDGGELHAALEAIRTGGVQELSQRSAERDGARPLAGGIAVLLAVALLVAINAGGIRDRLWRPAPLLESIAVLPLENRSGDPQQEYFVDGMQDALIQGLSRLSFNKVTARSSTQRFRNTEQTVPAVASILGVTRVVTGSVLRTGSRVQIQSRLLDGPTGRVLWQDSLEEDVRNAPALHDAIVTRIARAMDLAPPESGGQRQPRSGTVDPETYESYLRGMYFLNNRALSPADRRQGLAHLQEAVDRDPGDPHAWVGLAQGYTTIGHSPAASEDAWFRARLAAQNALKLAPDLAEANAAVAHVKLYHEWDWDAAARYFRRANELNPNLAMNHYHYAWYLALMDRTDEAVAAHKRAQELDPLTPAHTGWLGELYRYQGRYDDALAAARKAIEINERAPVGWLVLGGTYSSLGRHDEAVAALEQAVVVSPIQLGALGAAYGRAGRRAEARKIAAQLEEREPDAFMAWTLIDLYTGLGDLDAAFRWLDYRPHHAFFPWVRVQPEAAPLRADPRFAAVMQRMKLPPPKPH